MSGAFIGLMFGLMVLLIVFVAIVKTFRIIPQGRAAVVERLGRYSRTLQPGLHILVPFLDRVAVTVDLREQVVSFPPQSVITKDNLVLSIDSVIYFSVNNPVAANYNIADYLVGIEQLTLTTLRNVIGSMDLEETLTSRDSINGQLRSVLDEATSEWGIRVGRVELKAIDPPPSIQESMEKQMRAERDKRAAILNAEAYQKSKLLTADGDKQATVLAAQGNAESRLIQAQAEAEAIEKIATAVRSANMDETMLTYQYLQQIPYIANGTANKVWFIPSDVTDLLKGLGVNLAKNSNPAGVAKPHPHTVVPPLHGRTTEKD